MEKWLEMLNYEVNYVSFTKFMVDNCSSRSVRPSSLVSQAIQTSLPKFLKD